MVEAAQCLVEIDTGVPRVHVGRRGVGIDFHVLKAAASLYEQVEERLELFSLVSKVCDRWSPSDAEAATGGRGEERQSVDVGDWSEWLDALEADRGPVALVAVARRTRNRDDLTEVLLQCRASRLGGHDSVDTGRRPVGADACIHVELLLDHEAIAALANDTGEVHPTIRRMRLGLDRNHRGNRINEGVTLQGWRRSSARWHG